MKKYRFYIPLSVNEKIWKKKPASILSIDEFIKKKYNAVQNGWQVDSTGFCDPVFGFDNWFDAFKFKIFHLGIRRIKTK